MRINHNIAALGAYRYLSGANKSLSNSLEKLSSGLRINRASDDAAGMAISEKMKAQIRGLSQASRNSLDAVSLIQTAEGALNEVHSMLQRMRELAVQSANGTLTEEDREKNQAEVDQLTQAIDIVSRDTEFNTKKLLRGSDMQVGNTFIFGVDKKINRAAIVGDVTYPSWGVADIAFPDPTPPAILNISTGNVVEVGDRTYEFVDGNPAQEGNIAVEVPSGDTVANKLSRLSTVMNENMPSGVSNIAYTAATRTFTVTGDNDYYVMSNVNKSITLSFVGVPSAGDSLTLGGTKFVFANSADIIASPAVKVDLGGVQNVEDLMNSLTATVQTNLPGGVTGVGGGIKDERYEFKLLLNNGVTQAGMDAFNVSASSTDMFVSVQIGANASQSLILQVNNMSAAKLQLSFTETGLKVTDFSHMATNGVPITTPDDAEKAIDIIEKAIDLVSQERAKLGSYQNRLEHTINNLNVSEENLTASLSRIEDADMALEMSNYTKFNILVQSGTAMLAQANQIPQSVLQLLK